MPVNSKKQYVYIDESGTLGNAASRSPRFIVASVVIFDYVSNKIIDAEISKFRRSLNWNDLDEFHFRSTRKRIVIELLSNLNEFDYEAYALVVEKEKYAKENSLKNERDLYQAVLIDLLGRLPVDNVSILIDGQYGNKYMKRLKSKIRQELRQLKITVLRVDTVDSQKSNGVQLADLIAGSVARSYNKSKADAKKYIKVIHNKLTIFDK